MSLTAHDICQVSGVERSEEKPGGHAPGGENGDPNLVGAAIRPPEGHRDDVSGETLFVAARSRRTFLPSFQLVCRCDAIPR